MKTNRFWQNLFGAIIDRTATIQNRILAFAFIGFILFSCSEEANEPIGSKTGTPEMVKNIQVEALPGGAKLSYSLPSDKSLLYVEASLLTKDGRKLDFRSSSYISTIIIEGLSSDAEEEVSIRSVSTSGVKSEPQIIKIKPLEPPFLTTFKTLSAQPDFGGVNLKFENESKSELAYFLGYYDEDNQFVDYESYYTFESGNYSYRGLDAVERKFGIYIRDKWDNTSDTLEIDLTPYYETTIPKDKFKAMRLFNDSHENIGQWNVKMEFLWDGQYSQDYNDPHNANSNYGWLVFTFFDSPSIEPRFFTFDTGVLSKLSRIRMHHYFRYEASAPRICEFYGRADEPPLEGGEEGWIKLCRMEQIRPSLSNGAISMSDAEAWERGTEANVDYDAPPVRYIRVKAIEDWSGFSNWAGEELFFFGQVIEQ